jgi:hypothetical protein
MPRSAKENHLRLSRNMAYPITVEAAEMLEDLAAMREHPVAQVSRAAIFEYLTKHKNAILEWRKNEEALAAIEAAK